MVCPRCGHIFTKQAVWFYCHALRGILQSPQNGKEGSRPLPTNNREISYNLGKCKFPAGLLGTVLTVPCGLPGRSICRDCCNGRHICRPYGVPVIFVIIYGCGRGMPRPYRKANRKKRRPCRAALFIGRLCCYPNNQALAALISLISSGTTLYRSPTMP